MSSSDCHNDSFLFMILNKVIILDLSLVSIYRYYKPMTFPMYLTWHILVLLHGRAARAACRGWPGPAATRVRNASRMPCASGGASAQLPAGGRRRPTARSPARRPPRRAPGARPATAATSVGTWPPPGTAATVIADRGDERLAEHARSARAAGG